MLSIFDELSDHLCCRLDLVCQADALPCNEIHALDVPGGVGCRSHRVARMWHEGQRGDPPCAMPARFHSLHDDHLETRPERLVARHAFLRIKELSANLPSLARREIFRTEQRSWTAERGASFA